MIVIGTFALLFILFSMFFLIVGIRKSMSIRKEKQAFMQPFSQSPHSSNKEKKTYI